jgi:sporulation protein YlmC with PRC-barrel domain
LSARLRFNPVAAVGAGECGMLHGVLLLTGVTGRDVLGPDGRVLGRLADLTVRLSDQAGPQLVERLVVTRRRSPTLVLPWAVVANVGSDQVVLTVGAAEVAGFEVDSLAQALASDEILLRRDVLDTQIVDVVGQRLARVADVLFVSTADGRLELLGAEVGFGAVLRRLGLGRLGLGRVIPGLGDDVVAWSDLHLTSDRGHLVQLATPRAAVHRLDAAGLAALVSRVDTDAATEILAARDPGMAAEVVRAAHPDVGERMLRAMPDATAARIVAAMAAEHADPWRHRLARAPRLFGRRVVRSRVWPHRRHLIRGQRR